MSTIYRCKVTVKHPANSLLTPSEFVDWYDYPTLEDCKEVHDENMHRYGLSGEHCEAVWTLCDAETLKPLEDISVSKLFPSGAND